MRSGSSGTSGNRKAQKGDDYSRVRGLKLESLNVEHPQLDGWLAP